jgi:hypothetical protein
MSTATFYSAFGKTYEVALMPRTEIQSIIDNIDVNQIIAGAYSALPEMSGARCEVYLNCETGETFNHIQIGNGGIVESAHLCLLYSLDFQSIVEIPNSDIQGDDDLPESGDVKDYEDYNERVVECLRYYADNELNQAKITEQLDIMFQ